MTAGKNPIYCEYYPHENGDCFKINLPWSKYKTDKVVLCRADEGIQKAERLAVIAILNHLIECFDQPVIRAQSVTREVI